MIESLMDTIDDFQHREIIPSPSQVMENITHDGIPSRLARFLTASIYIVHDGNPTHRSLRHRLLL